MSSNEVVRIPNGLKNTGIFHFLSTVISNECISYLAIVFGPYYDMFAYIKGK